MSAPLPDPYATLQVPPTASSDAVRQAYRRRAKALHPDRNPDPDAAERFRALQQAYETLSDPGLRAAYDAELLKAQAEPLRRHPSPSAPSITLRSTKHIPAQETYESAPAYEAAGLIAGVGGLLLGLAGVIPVGVGLAVLLIALFSFQLYRFSRKVIVERKEVWRGDPLAVLDESGLHDYYSQVHAEWSDVVRVHPIWNEEAVEIEVTRRPGEPAGLFTLRTEAADESLLDVLRVIEAHTPHLTQADAHGTRVKP